VNNKFKFERKKRIKKNIDFQKVYKKGKRLFGKFYIFIYLKNDFNFPRLGISVSKKVGKSYLRNYEKRLIRNFFRYKINMLNNYDIIVIRKKNEGAYKQKEEDFGKLSNNLLKENI
jgi:ribonuclease P protein component